MKTRIRMNLKSTAKGTTTCDVTVDCELEESETSKDVASVLKESVVDFEATATELGYEVVKA